MKSRNRVGRDIRPSQRPTPDLRLCYKYDAPGNLPPAARMPDVLPIHPCIHCGFDLTGLPHEVVCPECGGERAKEEANEALQPAHAKAVATHLVLAIAALRVVVWACVGVGGLVALIVLAFVFEIRHTHWEAIASMLALVFPTAPIAVGVSLVRLGSPIARARELMRLYEPVMMNGRVLVIVSWVGAVAFFALAGMCIWSVLGFEMPTLPFSRLPLAYVPLFVTAITSSMLAYVAFRVAGALQAICDATLPPTPRLYCTFGVACVCLSLSAMFLVFCVIGSDMNILGAAFFSAITPIFLARGLRQWSMLHDRLQTISAFAPLTASETPPAPPSTPPNPVPASSPRCPPPPQP